jgi:CBS-domain-containing membrane protein
MSQLAVGAIMTTNVVTVPETMPVREVAALLAERGLTGVLVVDPAGHVLGVVSEFDLLGRAGTTCGEIMSRQVISVSEETPVDEVAQLFVNHRIRRVPVLAGGRLVGIVSRGDLLRGASLDQIRGPLDVVQRSSLTTGPLDIVQQASEESFPASDAPTYSQPEPTRPSAPGVPPEQG